MKIVFEEVFPEYVHSYGNVIRIPIMDTDEINSYLDDIRAVEGKRPFFDNLYGLEADTDGWYCVYLILDRASGEPQEIEAFVAEDCGAVEEDDEIYHIEVEDKMDVWNQIKSEMKKYDITFEELKEIN